MVPEGGRVGEGVPGREVGRVGKVHLFPGVVQRVEHEDDRRLPGGFLDGHEDAVFDAGAYREVFTHQAP